MIPQPGVAELAGPTRAAARNGVTALILLSLGHFFVDMYSSALGALQPLLVSKLSLSLTQAGILGGLLVFSSSLMQPAYGYLSDRLHSRHFTVLAPAVAGVFISCLGLAPTYALLIPLVLLGGAGVASFHPQASGRVTMGVASGRGAWMAIFISAGTMGMALGPTVFSQAAARLGLENIWWMALPGLAVSAFLFHSLPAEEMHAGRQRTRFDWQSLNAVRKPLLLLYLLVFVRSIVQITFAAFLPLYLSRERGFPVMTANYALSLYLLAGALGGFAGGHLADRIGGRRVIQISMIGCVPFLVLFFTTGGWASWVGLAMGGLVLLFTIPVNVVMAQELAPSQIGTVSALMMGFSWGMAGLIFIPLTGWISDMLTLHQTLSALALFPLLGFFLALRLPK